ncbi:hypothetical protein Ciccas_014076, partial [Cichlidogyrus casuarinus]
FAKNKVKVTDEMVYVVETETETETQNLGSPVEKERSRLRKRAPSQSLVLEIQQIMKKHYESQGVVLKPLGNNMQKRHSLFKNSQHASQPMLDKMLTDLGTSSSRVPRFRTTSVVAINLPPLRRVKSNSVFPGSSAFLTPPMLEQERNSSDSEHRSMSLLPPNMVVYDSDTPDNDHATMYSMHNHLPPLIIEQATPTSQQRSSVDLCAGLSDQDDLFFVPSSK